MKRTLGKLILMLAFLFLGCQEEANDPLTCGRATTACDSDGDCCGYNCLDDGTCDCRGEGEVCDKHEGCCTGMACEGGHCTAGCRPNDRGCELDSDCCAGTCEGTARLCEPARCNTEAEPCLANGDCCVDLACRAGTCQTGCGTATASCTVDSDCCSGFGCVGGTCEATCQMDGQSCDGASGPFCCMGLDCRSGSCGPCLQKGFTCTDTSECCSGLTCEGGICDCAETAQACTADGECCSGLLCHDMGCRASVLGERCTANVDCAQGTDLGCNGSECRPTIPRDPQEACIDGSDCASTLCEGGLCCVGDAQSCSEDPDCCGGMVCLSGTSLCSAPLGNGASCSRDVECAQGRCEAGVCRPEVGDTCSAPAECLDSSTCGPESLCCFSLGQSCGGVAECCGLSDLDCQGSPGLEKCCRPVGTSCGSVNDCCNPSTKMCLTGSCCGRAGQTCGVDGDCCGGTCVGTVCAVSDPGEPCVNATDCGGGAASCVTGTCCITGSGTCSLDSDCCSGSCLGNNTCQ